MAWDLQGPYMAPQNQTSKCCLSVTKVWPQMEDLWGIFGKTPALVCLCIWLRWDGFPLFKAQTHTVYTPGVEPGHSRVCGSKRPKTLADVNTGFSILSLAREVWLQASVDQEAAVTDMDGYFPGTLGASQISAQGWEKCDNSPKI